MIPSMSSFNVPFFSRSQFQNKNTNPSSRSADRYTAHALKFGSQYIPVSVKEASDKLNLLDFSESEEKTRLMENEAERFLKKAEEALEIKRGLNDSGYLEALFVAYKENAPHIIYVNNAPIYSNKKKNTFTEALGVKKTWDHAPEYKGLPQPTHIYRSFNGLEPYHHPMYKKGALSLVQPNWESAHKVYDKLKKDGLEPFIVKANAFYIDYIIGKDGIGHSLCTPRDQERTLERVLGIQPESKTEGTPAAKTPSDTKPQEPVFREQDEVPGDNAFLTAFEGTSWTPGSRSWLNTPPSPEEQERQLNRNNSTDS